MIWHGKLMKLIEWHRGHYGILPGDRSTHIAGLGFDASVWEVWPYLGGGARLIFREKEELRSDPGQLQQWLLRTEISIGFVPTPMAEQLLHREWPRGGHLRALLKGGDR